MVNVISNACLPQTHPLNQSSHLNQLLLLLLAIKNFFNEVSQSVTLHTLEQHQELKPLIPFFHLLYDNPSRCFFQRPDKTYDSFFGYPQGDPLSPMLTALVLALLLLKPPNAELQEKSQSLHSSIPQCN
mmetsp:Transcript_9328/g.14377  ORF Transcript_9328/g.14377 Transcript_9328/m.14377 type:complete len:129 (-) Transcript_9328:1439-1825(-)